MDKINITISNDKLEARITTKKHGGTFPSKPEIYDAIQTAGVVYGIDDSIIEKVVNDHQPVSNLVFAIGDPPVNGKDAKLVWFIDVNPTIKPTITEEGIADFRHLKKQFEAVKIGQELVSRLPHTKGNEGKAVTGEIISSPGRDFPLPVGKNTLVSKDSLTLKAKINGYAFWQSGKLHVDNVYHVKGNVDFSTGNMKFNGTLFINGDVRSGFRVDATESIFVGGNVEAADLYSQNGDIFIQLGVLGKGRAKILAGGNLRCGFIQDATAVAKGDILIERYAINSQLSSGGNVVVKQNEGLIRGGRIYAEDGIEANEIGSDQKKATEIGISRNELYEVSSKIRDIEDQLVEMNSWLAVLNKRIEFLNLLNDRLKGLSVEKRRILRKTRKDVRLIRHRIGNMELELLSVTQKETKQIPSNYIVVNEKLHRGVTITIGNQLYYTDTLFQGVKIYCDGDTIAFKEIYNEQ